MTLTIELSPGVESRLAAHAAKQGTTAEAVVKELVEQKFGEPRTLAEIVAPVAAEFAASGMTEEDLDVLIEEAREEIYFEKHGRPSKQR